MKDIKKHQKFLELKKKYGFDIAVLKQSGAETDEDELFRSLLLFDVQSKVVDAINDYADAVEGNPAELASLVTMLFNSSGEIIGQIARHDPAYVVICKEIAIKQFQKHIRDFFNGKPN